MEKKSAKNCCCCSVLNFKRDERASEQLNIPLIIQFAGNTLFRNCLHIGYLFIRVFFAIYGIFIIIWNLVRFVEQGYGQFWPYYFTQWLGLLTTVYFVIASYIHLNLAFYVKKYLSDKTQSILNLNDDLSIDPPLYSRLDILLGTAKEDDVRHLEFLEKVGNFNMNLYQFVLSPQLWIVVGYWTTVFPSAKEWDAPELANDIHMHGIYLVMLIFEFIYNPMLLRFDGCVWSLLFASLWGIWTLLHYSLNLKDYKGNRYIYALMNWGEYPMTAIILWIFTIISVPLIHFAFVKIKIKILRNWNEQFLVEKRTSLENASHNGSNTTNEIETFNDNNNATSNNSNTTNSNNNNSNNNINDINDGRTTVANTRQDKQGIESATSTPMKGPTATDITDRFHSSSN